MTDRVLLEKVLEAMEHLNRTGDTQVFDLCYAPELIPALRERLAQPEPVIDKSAAIRIATALGWVPPSDTSQERVDQAQKQRQEQEPTVKWDASAPLVVTPHPAFQATPQRREWVGLTDEKWKELWEEFNDGLDALEEEFQERMTVKHGEGYYPVNPEESWKSQQKLIQRLVEAKLKEKNNG